MERKLLLLGMLRIQAMHGYQLNEMIDAHVESGLHLKKPTMYKLLNNMVEDGWLSSKSQKEGNYPTRHVYSLTQKGEDAFMELLRDSLASYSPVDYPENVGLLFRNELPEDELVSLLRQRRESLCIHLKKAKELLDYDNAHDLIVKHKILHLETERAWLDEVIQDIEQHELQYR